MWDSADKRFFRYRYGAKYSDCRKKVKRLALWTSFKVSGAAANCCKNYLCYRRGKIRRAILIMSEEIGFYYYYNDMLRLICPWVRNFTNCRSCKISFVPQGLTFNYKSSPAAKPQGCLFVCTEAFIYRHANLKMSEFFKKLFEFLTPFLTPQNVKSRRKLVKNKKKKTAQIPWNLRI